MAINEKGFCLGQTTDAANGSAWSCSDCRWYDDHGPSPHVPVVVSEVEVVRELDALNIEAPEYVRRWMQHQGFYDDPGRCCGECDG